MRRSSSQSSNRHCDHLLEKPASAGAGFLFGVPRELHSQKHKEKIWSVEIRPKFLDHILLSSAPLQSFLCAPL